VKYITDLAGNALNKFENKEVKFNNLTSDKKASKWEAFFHTKKPPYISN